MALLTNITYNHRGTTINVAPTSSCCKLIYNEGVVQTLVRVCISDTKTPKTLECYPTLQEAYDRITSLGLTGFTGDV